MISVGQSVLGKYVVLHPLGKGGMGEVYAVRHTELGETFALKILPATARTDAHGERLRREARAAARVRGEHAARVVDVGQLDDGCPYILMEHVDGKSLLTLLTERGPIPVPEAVTWVLHAACGLAEAHAHGIVHRDVKPSNLLLTRRADGTPIVKVLDFGIAKSLGATADTLTSAGATLGSPAYMSPEQVRDARTVGPATDWWSLGVVLYELVSGAQPFFAYTVPGVFARILTEPPTDIRSVVPDAPDALVAALDALLQKDPDARVATAARFAELLRPLAPNDDDVVRVLRIADHVTAQKVDVSPVVAQARDDVGATTEDPTAATRPHDVTTVAAPVARRGRAAVVAGVVAVAAVTALVVATRRNDAPTTRSPAVVASSIAPPITTSEPSATPPTPDVSAVAAPPPALAPSASAARPQKRPVVAPPPAPSAEPPPAATAGFGRRH